MRRLTFLMLALALVWAIPAQAWESMGWDKGKKVASKSKAALTLTVGSGGQYATFLEARKALPTVLSHNTTITVKQGTTLTEIVDLSDLVVDAWDETGAGGVISFTLQAEGYFPTNAAIPTASSAAATTLVDSGIGWTASAYVNSWVLIVDGTGTDNGYVKITANTTDTLSVASWPGTQPDSTSKYIIVGALIDGSDSQTYGIKMHVGAAHIYVKGIGIKDCLYGISPFGAQLLEIYYCGVYSCTYAGLYSGGNNYVIIYRSGFVGNNTSDTATQAGIKSEYNLKLMIQESYLSDNGIYGIYGLSGSHIESKSSGGDGNGTWGAYLTNGSTYTLTGSWPTGSSGGLSQTFDGFTLDADLTSLAAGITGIVVGAGDAGGYAAGVAGTEYLSPAYIEDAAYGSGWDTDTTHAPSQNAVYDAMQVTRGIHEAIAANTDPFAITPTGGWTAALRFDFWITDTTDGGDIALSETGPPADGTIAVLHNASSNTIEIPNSDGNLEIPNDGTVVLEVYESYAVVYRTDRWVPVSDKSTANFATLTTVETEFIPVGWMIDGASAPDAIATFTSGTEKREARTFAGDADEDLRFDWKAPLDLDVTSGIKFEVNCIVTNATGPSTETWQFELQGCSSGSGDPLDCTLGTAQTSNSGSRTDAQYDLVDTAYSEAMTSTHITDLAVGEMIQFKLYRDVDDTDTYAQVVGVIGITVKYKRFHNATF